jgi:hypothetical protein
MLLPKIKAILRDNNYELFSRPFELNIVGLRSKSTVANKFDDEMHVFYRIGALKWKYYIFKITTDPGTFWLNNPMQQKGTAILAEGQYKNAYQLGLHRNKYLALVQRKEMTIIRDYNRDAILDFNNGRRTTGIDGINIHRANQVGTTKLIGKNSAGCQVFENADQFALFIKMCQKHKTLYGNAFTYTLIDFRAVRRQNLRYLTYSFGAVALASMGVIGIKYHEPIKEYFNEMLGKVKGDPLREAQ